MGQGALYRRTVGVGLGLVIAIGSEVPASSAFAFQVPTTDVEMPGTQPGEVAGFEQATKCDNCHGGYDLAVEPAHLWRGSMMSQASRDPIFWATVAIAEQDFPGAGDLCLRCHTLNAWLEGRSVPTDGTSLLASDVEGVSCDVCHKMVNPDDSEWLGTQFPPYLANDEGNPPTGYYGGGQGVMWSGADKLGPYVDAQARHQFLQSGYHRSRDFCGTCHDVSNPVVGDLAHNAGAQDTADPVVQSGIPGGPVEDKAALNNFPYQYGIVERTYSEHRASAVDDLLVSDYNTLPAELQGGAFRFAYEQSLLAGTGGNYEDNTPRYFTCQTCHLQPVVGKGCNKQGVPLRGDQPLHDMTGGNYWIPDVLQYLDTQGKLQIGPALTVAELAGLAEGKARAQATLGRAASIAVEGNTARIVNLTGHKLISGYPEGRRMWLKVEWYDDRGVEIREDGEYDEIEVLIDGQPTLVKTIVNLNDPNTKIYEVHQGMTQEWAQQLIDLGYPSDMVLTYDRITGEPTYTLGEVAAQDPGTYHETFHFVLNNYISKDNRIPPYGLEYEAARQRNVLPVPNDQYGAPGPGESYDYWDEFVLNPPSRAVRADVSLMYQSTSWEYIQFLYLANQGNNAFLAQTGSNLLEAWLMTGMADPVVLAHAVWNGDGGGRDLGNAGSSEHRVPGSSQKIPPR